MKEQLVKQLLVIEDTHSRNTCSDSDPNKWYAGSGCYAPKCTRCALIKASNDEKFRNAISLFDFEIQVPEYEKYEEQGEAVKSQENSEAG